MEEPEILESSRLHLTLPLAPDHAGEWVARVLEKIGMRHEGRQREHLLHEGRLVDLDHWGILRREHEGG